MPNTEPDPSNETRRLARAVEALNASRLVRMHDSWLRVLWFQFLRGLAFGLGTVVGASALVSLLVLFLSQFEFVPIVGDWVTQIIHEIETTKSSQ